MRACMRAASRGGAHEWAGGSARPPSGLRAGGGGLRRHWPSRRRCWSPLSWMRPTEKLNPQYKHNRMRILYSVPRPEVPPTSPQANHAVGGSGPTPARYRATATHARPSHIPPSRVGAGIHLQRWAVTVGALSYGNSAWWCRPPHSRRRLLISDATQKRVAVVVVTV
ncbi:unnamed protein product [Musa banksii]